MKIGIYYAVGLGESIGATREEVLAVENALNDWWTYSLGHSRSFTPHDIGSRSPDERRLNDLVWGMQAVERSLASTKWSKMEKAPFVKALRSCLEYQTVYDSRFSPQLEIFCAAMVESVRATPRPKWMNFV